MTRLPLSTNALPWIQVLRGLAASLVVAGHSLLEARTLYPAWRVLETGFAYGYGVDVFFVISGFIMVHSAGKRFGNVRNASEFLLRRIIRIAPLYWMATLGVAIAAHFMPQIINGRPPGGGETLRSLLFIPYARMTGEVLPILPVGWTLNYEMMFYALFAVVMLVKFRPGITALALALCALAGVGLLLQPAAVLPRFWTDSIILEFLFGIGIGVLYRTAFRPSVFLLFATGSLALFSSYLAITEQLAGPRFLAAGIPAALTVFTAAFAFNARKGVLLSLFIALGDASYSLYIGHMYSIRFLRELWHSWALTSVPAPAFIGLAFCWACAFAFLVHKLVEVPMTNWLNKALVSRWYTAPARAAVAVDYSGSL